MLSALSNLCRGRLCDGLHGAGAVDPDTFVYTVPARAAAGEHMRAVSPSGEEVEIVLPHGCKEGQRIRVRVDPRRREFNAFLRSTSDFLDARRVQAGEHLTEQFELQRVAWETEEWSAPEAGHFQGLVAEVVAISDGEQLLGALEEAKPFCKVSSDLEAAARELMDSEAAAITWRCLIDAVRAEDVSAVEAWAEEARRLGISVPAHHLVSLPASASADGNGAAPESRSAATAGAASSASSPAAMSDHYDAMRTHELLQECRRRCLRPGGCTERGDLLEILRQADEAEAAARSQAAGGASTAAPVAGNAGAKTTVWDRRRPPPNLVAPRREALYLLGLDTAPGRQCTAAEVKAAYRRAAMECHPDKAQNHSRQDEAKVLFQRVREAFDLITKEEGFAS